MTFWIHNFAFVVVLTDHAMLTWGADGLPGDLTDHAMLTWGADGFYGDRGSLT